MSSTVAIIHCASYDEAEVHEAVGRGLGLLGGASHFVRAGESILLKPNFLTSATPDAAVTTHPSVFAAVAQHLKSAGAELSYGDSPGFGSSAGVARKSGIAEVADRLGIRAADFSEGRDVPFPDGSLVKRFFLADPVIEADGLVSLAKMKSHQLTRITGAVKNQFGCIPGLRKGEFHARMGDVDRFSRMLVDLNRLIGPRLFVMDGIVAMEGNGPRNGTPRPMNVLLLSEDPVALDAVFCRLVDLDVDLVATCVYGEQAGLGTKSDVVLVGDAIDEHVAADFDVNRAAMSTTGNAEGGLGGFMRRYVTPRPTIRANRCTKCGTCVRLCPVDPKAVDWATEGGAADGQPPQHHYERCIRCYCCQELCPENAIEVDIPLLGRVLHR